MADNYLERRMEDYRAGKLAPAHRSAASAGRAVRREGELILKFPRLRVLVAGSAGGTGEAVVRAFREIDCRVDFLDADYTAGNALAQKSGARFYRTDLGCGEKLEENLSRVFADRGDIDVMVLDPAIGADPLNICMAALARRRESLPEANAYGGRVIILGKATAAGDMTAALARFGVTVNTLSADGTAHTDALAGWVRFLALSQNAFINGSDISFKKFSFSKTFGI